MFLVQPVAVQTPDVWHALSDSTRRTLIDRLASGAKTTSELCRDMPMSRFGVMKHLGVLERAGLIVARRHGRLRLNYLNAAPLRAIQNRWLSSRAEALAGGIEKFTADLEGRDMTDIRQTEPAGVVDIALEWPVAASPQRVWAALFEHPQRWWPANHRAVGSDAVMSFEARVGGQLREEARTGAGVLWYEVIALDPMRSVDLAGSLAARYGGPAKSLLHIEVAPGPADGSSVLKLTDSVFGRIGPELRASLITGWQAIVGEAFVRFAEDGQ
jgi:DNA-binding transcriptional ArsR family regulator